MLTTEYWDCVVPSDGFEPSTYRLGGGCSQESHPLFGGVSSWSCGSHPTIRARWEVATAQLQKEISEKHPNLLDTLVARGR